jgi:uncharacterized membrane protein
MLICPRCHNAKPTLRHKGVCYHCHKERVRDRITDVLSSVPYVGTFLFVAWKTLGKLIHG